MKVFGLHDPTNRGSILGKTMNFIFKVATAAVARTQTVSEAIKLPDREANHSTIGEDKE